MVVSGFGRYHRLVHDNAPTEHAGVIPTPWAMPLALGLGTIHRPSPLSRHLVHCCPPDWAVYCRQIAIASSTVHRRPASITEVLSIAVALSIAIEPYIAIAPSIAVSHPAGCCVASRHINASRPPVEEFPCGMFNLFLMRGTILWHVEKLHVLLRRIWITNKDEIWIGHYVVCSVLSGCLMGARWVWARFWQSGWCRMTMIT